MFNPSFAADSFEVADTPTAEEITALLEEDATLAAELAEFMSDMAAATELADEEFLPLYSNLGAA
jgi:hypothetical protein